MAKPYSLARVLAPYVTRADFEQAASDLGFGHFDTSPGDARRAYEQIWANAERTASLNHIEDKLLRLSYVHVRSVEQDLCARVLSDISHSLSVFSPEDILTILTRATDLDAIYINLARASATFYDFDQRAFDIIHEFAVNSPIEDVRDEALNTMVYRCWKEWVPVLESIIANDPSPAIRSRAQEVLAAYSTASQ